MGHKISAILWDIDGTLLNFPAAEEAAINACFGKFNLGECTKDMLRRYAAINLGYWKMIERGEIDKGRALAARFEDFFAEYGLNVSVAAAFNDEYQIRLGDTVVFEHGAYDAVASLKGVVKQYAVTNGTRTAQRRKLKNSGLDRLLDGVFISEEIGAEKPGEAFFDFVFSHIDAPRAETVIIGDSLTSDMLGGERAGIRCCWDNPMNQPRGGTKIDWELKDLADMWTLWAHEPLRAAAGQERRLPDFRQIGLFKTAFDESALYAMEYEAAHGGGFVCHVRGALCRTTEDFFREVSAALRFPRYFGFNWAALDECLQDLEWLAFARLLIVVDDYGDVFREEGSGRETERALLEKHLSGAVEAWTAHGVPIAVLLNEKNA